jgi:hypothetical protein
MEYNKESCIRRNSDDKSGTASDIACGIFSFPFTTFLSSITFVSSSLFVHITTVFQATTFRFYVMVRLQTNFSRRFTA